MQGEIVIEIDSAHHQIDNSSENDSPYQKATRSAAFYHQAIHEAVNDNQLKKAVSLLEEAESLGVEGAREAFNKAVNAAAAQ